MEGSPHLALPSTWNNESPGAWNKALRNSVGGYARQRQSARGTALAQAPHKLSSPTLSPAYNRVRGFDPGASEPKSVARLSPTADRNLS